MSDHNPDCDVNDFNLEGIKKPCNCGAASELPSSTGSADYLCGNCVVCGKYLGEADYNCQAVVAAIGPEGTIVCCVGHLFYGPRERSPGYEDAILKIAEAKAIQCGWKPPNMEISDEHVTLSKLR